MKYNCIIIDDEPDAHTVLNHHIKTIGEIHLIAAFFSAQEALQFQDWDSIDFIFLDINMPEISGFGFLSLLKQNIKIIFTTAHSKFALQSFEHNVVDYLLKPISYSRFSTAINKLDNTATPKPPIPPAIRFQGYEQDIDPNLISFAESFGNYVKIHFPNKKSILIHNTLQNVAETLRPYHFKRIHKKYLINTNFVKQINKDEIILIDNQTLPIGISYRQMVVGTLKNL
ncbi:MAG: LytTR family DNA-binding domain-containing protein [Spirosomaceae bacterium]|jgi:DNA-binding LytR/AlgR family response regulator|nr:LytTR family DNA-binding domain-containing protein [Spirosomataceae bacterium]